MENFYTAYSKQVQGTTFYFVKRFVTFPEYLNVSPWLENFGMHTNFDKACKIADISDDVIKKRLWEEIMGNIQQARVIEFNKDNFTGKLKTS